MADRTIAIVINTAWNIANFRLGLLKALQEDGYRIITIAPEDDCVATLQSQGFEYTDLEINNKGTNPFEDLGLIFRFYSLFKHHQPDILLHYTIKPNIYGTIAATMAGIPVISNISGLGTIFLNDRLSSKVARGLYRLALRFPKRVFFQNQDDRALFVKTKLAAAAKTDLLPGSGIDTEKFAPARKVSPGALDSFLFIARLVKDKGLLEYVEAARILKQEFPGVYFKILGAYYPGNPTAISEQEMTAWQSEGVIDYLGSCDDVVSIIAESDCVVLPSYREGLSRVLLEAASMAKPIVTTDVPGCRDVVDDGVNGLLCEAKNREDLATQMRKMILMEPSKRLAMGQKGRDKVVKDFDEALVIEKYRAAIRDILSAR